MRRAAIRRPAFFDFEAPIDVGKSRFPCLESWEVRKELHSHASQSHRQEPRHRRGTSHPRRRSSATVPQKYFEGTVHAQVTVAKQRSSRSDRIAACIWQPALYCSRMAPRRKHLPSFDGAAQHLEKQLKRYKQRLKSHHRTGAIRCARKPHRYVISAAAADEEGEEPVETQPGHHCRAGHQRTGTFRRRSRHDAGNFSVSLSCCSATARVAAPASSTGAADGNIGWVEPKTCSVSREVHIMTDLADIIEARAVLPSVKAQGKKQLLQELSQVSAKAWR